MVSIRVGCGRNSGEDNSLLSSTEGVDNGKAGKNTPGTIHEIESGLLIQRMAEANGLITDACPRWYIGGIKFRGIVRNSCHRFYCTVHEAFSSSENHFGFIIRVHRQSNSESPILRLAYEHRVEGDTMCIAKDFKCILPT